MKINFNNWDYIEDNWIKIPKNKNKKYYKKLIGSKVKINPNNILRYTHKNIIGIIDGYTSNKNYCFHVKWNNNKKDIYSINEILIMQDQIILTNKKYNRIIKWYFKFKYYILSNK